MTNEKKLKVIEEAFNYYHDRTSLTSKEEKELLLLVNELYAAINYTQFCETLKGGKEHNIDVAHNGYCTKCRCREIKRV